MDELTAYIQNLIQYAGDAIFTVGKSQCILSWNLGAQELLGYTPEEIVGKPVDMLSPLDQKRLMRSMVIEVMDGGTLKNLELELTGKNDASVTAYVTASPVRDITAEVVAVSVIAKDITDQNKLLLALIQKEKRAAHLEAMVEALTTLSHYIRNAAAVISAKAELSGEMDRVESYRELSQTCIRETRRITAVIESLHDLIDDVRVRDAAVTTVEMSGAPSKLVDIEVRLAEKLKRIDDEFSK
jgi:PAS domain S-box-containing protein